MGKESREKMKGTPVECTECGAIVAVRVSGDAKEVPCPAQSEQADAYDIPEYCKNK